jgi:hypothetical protein
MPMLLSSATAAGVGSDPQRPRFEVADIVREYGAAFRATHHVSHEQEGVLRAIAQCRTAALGGHVEARESCGAEQICYNSCRNRHCPKCQGTAQAKWLATEQALLLPVPYFHVVFTLPHPLNPLIRVNQRALYGLLFQAAAQTLQHFARDPKHLGAEIGITAVLHTWGQTLTEHIHVHCVVTGGGLTADGTQWRPSRRRFLFAVKALSKVLRGKYLAGLSRLRSHHQLLFTGASAPLADDSTWTAFLGELHRTPWVVYSKPPFGGPQQVLKYLSRYTHRVAITNARLVFVGNGVVRFRYKDYATAGTSKVMELRAEEFLRRFVLHVVPPHFVRIRHFGLLANRCRQDKLAPCRQLLAATPWAAAAPSTTTQGTDTSVASKEPPTCPICGQGRLRIIEILLPQRGIPP